MSEETQNDGTWSGLKKTVIGTLTTVVTGGGIWLSTTLFGGHSEDKKETKTEAAAPAPAPFRAYRSSDHRRCRLHRPTPPSGWRVG